MIYHEVSKVTYQNITRVELMMMDENKMNPFSLFDNISLKDFDAYMNAMSERAKQRAKQKSSNSKDLGSMLVNLRDYLTFMTT